MKDLKIQMTVQLCPVMTDIVFTNYIFDRYVSSFSRTSSRYHYVSPVTGEDGRAYESGVGDRDVCARWNLTHRLWGRRDNVASVVDTDEDREVPLYVKFLGEIIDSVSVEWRW